MDPIEYLKTAYNLPPCNKIYDVHNNINSLGFILSRYIDAIEGNDRIEKWLINCSFYLNSALISGVIIKTRYKHNALYIIAIMKDLKHSEISLDNSYMGDIYLFNISKIPLQMVEIF